MKFVQIYRIIERYCPNIKLTFVGLAGFLYWKFGMMETFSIIKTTTFQFCCIKKKNKNKKMFSIPVRLVCNRNSVRERVRRKQF